MRHTWKFLLLTTFCIWSFLLGNLINNFFISKSEPESKANVAKCTPCSPLLSEVQIDNTLKLFEETGKTKLSPAYYADKVFTDSPPTFLGFLVQKKIKFQELSKLEQKVFILWNAEGFEHRMAYFETSIEETGATPEQKVRFRLIRQQFAKKFEMLIARFFSEIEDNEVAESEKKDYINRIRRWHKEEHLVDWNLVER